MPPITSLLRFLVEAGASGDGIVSSAGKESCSNAVGASVSNSTSGISESWGGNLFEFCGRRLGQSADSQHDKTSLSQLDTY